MMPLLTPYPARLAYAWRCLLAVLALGWAPQLPAATVPCGGVAPLTRVSAQPLPGMVYVLGDSISEGLAQDGLADKMRDRFGSTVRISADVGRSITTPGVQIRQSALESVTQDQAYIARADTIIVVLGTNQIEASFANSQQLLMWQLKALAPDARFYWVDIGATLANQVAGWNARNRVIYDNAPMLDYQMISRYKAIFGADADPLNITPGRNFPDQATEPGYGAEGNLHGVSAALSQAILQALAPPSPVQARANTRQGGCSAGA